MKFPRIILIKNKIIDLSERASLKMPNNIADIRRFAKILVIDDNTFSAEEFLKTNGYQIQHKEDIDSILDVEPYDIIMCDISGVGKKLGFDKEGARIIKEIHTQYPCKIIIAYSANTYDANYNKYFSLADFVAPKDLGIDDWIDVLDDQVSKVINPICQWKKIRTYLLENNVSTITVAQIEDKYVSSIEKKNFDLLTQFVDGNESKFSSIFTDFVSSLCAKVILGAIGGV